MNPEPDNELRPEEEVTSPFGLHERNPAGDAPSGPGTSHEEEPFEPIDRVEFRRGLNDIHRGILETDAFGATHRKLDELRTLAGWTLLTVGIYIALIGFLVSAGKKSRP